MTFNEAEAFNYLKKREMEKKEEREILRIKCLEEAKIFLGEKFKGQPVELFLVGSITRPYAFSQNSDIDIVIVNFQGDRFALWAELESALKRTVELIPFESCPFQEEVKKSGIKVK